jgi:hypothetical protein
MTKRLLAAKNKEILRLIKIIQKTISIKNSQIKKLKEHENIIKFDQPTEEELYDKITNCCGC